jgi:hypothetical protein
VDPEGQENVIYDSTVVGGEEESPAGKGLHQVDNSQDGYYFLDELSNGESGVVDLTISLDGETQGNSYQDALAQLQMNFAVEKARKSGGGSSHKSSGDSGSGTVVTVSPQVVATTVPQTGDTTHLLLLSLIAMLSGGVLLFWGVLWIRRYRRNREVQK